MSSMRLVNLHNKMESLTEDNMIIKKLNKSTYDVCFSDIGWDLWARFERNKNHLKLVKGNAMPGHLYTKLIKEVITNGNS